MSRREINAHIGDVKVGKGDDILRALLGSCIGVAILWPNKGVYGLAHCLLSEAPKRTSKIDGRYVDQAISSLLVLMHIHKENYPEIQVVIAGGGNMTLPGDTDPEKLVGYKNATTAFRCLKELKLRVVESDTGGIVGRKISIDCLTGEYSIQKIPRSAAA